jgi:hypothetical protein
LATLSIILWALSQFATETGLVDPKVFEWKFNPFAWQILFFIPLIFGASRGHEALFKFLERHKRVTLVSGVLAALFTVSRVLHLEYSVPGYWLITSKGNLGALHLFHAIIVIVLYCGLLTISPKIPTLPPLRALACIGRQTLYCYIASAWLTYALAFGFGRLGGGYFAYLAAALFSVLATFAVAVLFDARSAKRAAAGKTGRPQ